MQPWSRDSQKIPPQFRTRGDFFALRHIVGTDLVRFFHNWARFGARTDGTLARTAGGVPAGKMKTRDAIRHFMAGLLAFVIAGTAAPSFAATASDLFADGNRLFREDLYWAALLRYNEAAEAGMDTPLLHYNTGVAHYKAQQHNRARMSLEKAAAYGPLAPVAHYNLGLNAYAAGAYEEAMGWFRRAASQQERKDIARLSRQAMGRLRETRAEEEPAIVARTVVREAYQFTNF